MSEPDSKLINLLKTLKDRPFSTWSYEEKCSAKDDRPTPHLEVTVVDGKQKRKFQNFWYSKYSWLAGCTVSKKLFCYVCILFGGEKEWSLHGVDVTKNVERKCRKHENSKKHIQNLESHHLHGRGRTEHVLSKGAKLQAIKHNQTVKQNRLVVQRLIEVVCFLGKQELAFRGHFEDERSDNKGNYLELLELLSQQEQFLRDHLNSTSAFKGTSSDIQKELIQAITHVLKQEIKEEIGSCEFVSVQADETLDVSCRSQLSIILRYCFKSMITERFVGFYDVSTEKSAEKLSKIIIAVLKEWDVVEKIVCQTYDGASVMAGNQGGVQHFVKQICPRATFLHCYAHRLNLVLLHCSKVIKQVRLFTYDLTAFHTFFSKSAKRTQLLVSKGFRLPQASTTRWNFHSRAVTTITTHYTDLKNVFEHITENDEDWDGQSYNAAVGLLNILQKTQFLYLLCLFREIFVHCDHLFALLQIKVLLT